ncbi:MAG: ATP-grasp domain-containing protein [Oscillospiraceae bacterium]|nr:ATP-grasp domain-containing protein [Oscillospiraceae bacterium]
MNFRGVRILLLDGYGRQIPSVLRQLHDLGCVVTTVNSSRLDVGYTSRYPSRRLLCKDSKNNLEALKRLLDEEIPSGRYDAVFPMLEPSTELCLQYEEVYGKHVRIIAAPREAFEIAYDKQKTMMACMNNGIQCPRTKADGEAFDDFLSKVGFPLAVKPRKGTGSIGFHRINNMHEWKALLGTGFQPEENVIQEYIPQTDTQYIGIFMLDQNQELKSAVICDKHRWYPIDGGAASYVQTVDKPELIESGYRLLKAIGWKGEAHLDFIGDPRENGRAKLMEINGRIPASIKICWCVGIPIIQQDLQYAFDQPVENHLKSTKKGYGLRYLQTDFLWLLKSPNRFHTSPSWFDFRNSQDFIWSWQDPVPFLSYSVSHLLSFRRDMKKRKR